MYIPATSLQANLVQAYQETDYHVFTDPPFKLNVGQASDELKRLHQAHSVVCSAYLTAWNPEGMWAGAEQNSAKQAALMNALDKRGKPFLPGLGRHPSGQWSGEASVLALGVSEEEARELGSLFRQNAVVWCGEDAIPRLLLLR